MDVAWWCVRKRIWFHAGIRACDTRVIILKIEGQRLSFFKFISENIQACNCCIRSCFWKAPRVWGRWAPCFSTDCLWRGSRGTPSHFLLLTFLSLTTTPLFQFFFSFNFLSYFQVENNPYDPSLMVFMDYRDHEMKKNQSLFNEAENPTFLYAMPLSSTRVFFEVFCQLNLFSILYYIINL